MNSFCRLKFSVLKWPILLQTYGRWPKFEPTTLPLLSVSLKNCCNSSPDWLRILHFESGKNIKLKESRSFSPNILVISAILRKDQPKMNERKIKLGNWAYTRIDHAKQWMGRPVHAKLMGFGEISSLPPSICTARTATKRCNVYLIFF